MILTCSDIQAPVEITVLDHTGFCFYSTNTQLTNTFIIIFSLKEKIKITYQLNIVEWEHAVYVQAGGGIVADSIPENEYMESYNKALAVMNAVKNAKEVLE